MPILDYYRTSRPLLPPHTQPTITRLPYRPSRPQGEAIANFFDKEVAGLRKDPVSRGWVGAAIPPISPAELKDVWQPKQSTSNALSSIVDLSPSDQDKHDRFSSSKVKVGDTVRIVYEGEVHTFKTVGESLSWDYENTNGSYRRNIFASIKSWQRPWIRVDLPDGSPTKVMEVQVDSQTHKIQPLPTVRSDADGRKWFKWYGTFKTCDDAPVDEVLHSAAANLKRLVDDRKHQQDGLNQLDVKRLEQLMDALVERKAYRARSACVEVERKAVHKQIANRQICIVDRLKIALVRVGESVEDTLKAVTSAINNHL